MNRHVTALLVVIALIVVVATPLSAGATPREVWIKAKCALCHGEDGASNTPAGKQTKAPDLRLPDFQKLTDVQMRQRVTEGHAKMPSFKASLNSDQVFLLVLYLRSLGKSDGKP